MKSRKLIFLFVAAMMLALTYAPSASAGGKTIWENPENPCNKLSFGGDMRFRYETGSNTTATVSDDRDRERIRVRLNIKYDTGKGAVAGIRLATVPTSNNTQNQTLEGTDEQGDPSGNIGLANFGIGRAFIKFKHGSGGWLMGGKFGLPTKQLSNTWLNGSFNPEGIALGYKAAVGEGKISLVVGQLMIDEKGYADEGDEKAILAGLHWGGKVGGDVKLDVAFTNLAIDRTIGSPSTIDDQSYTLMLVGAKWNQISGGIEIFNSDISTDGTGEESSDATGMTVHVRYKINDMLGVRVYFYDVGEVSAPIPTTDFAFQDRNFTGTKIQLDVKAGGVNMDLRLLSQKVKNEDIDTWDEASMTQLNFVVGF